ncbi:hypothetical protein ACIBM4_34650 [Streptomyces sp. NPDC050256]|uniref:hypothetical protein n=1 Tax=unclassified Streptomyces TaxID=2593676 RepID=UPI0037994782
MGWAATALGSGQFSAVERCKDLEGLSAHFNAQRSGGQGYLEARLPGSEFPLLTLGFRDDQAVIHLFDAADQAFLLGGDGSAAADSMGHVPIVDDVAVFCGNFILTVDRAWFLLCQFIQEGSPSELGEWHEM